MADIALLRKLDCGDILNVVSEVKAALTGKGHSELAHRILLRVSNLCIDTSGAKKPVLTDDYEALELALLCCKAISADARNDEELPKKSRTIIAFFNIYSRFYANKNIECAMKFLDEVHPILKKMAPSMLESDLKFIYNFVTKTYNLILTAADSVFKEDPKAPISPLDLWDRMLLISSLLNPDKSFAHVVSVLKIMSMKYEKCHGLKEVEKCQSFNNVLLDKLVSYTIMCPKLESRESIDQVFSTLVLILQQCLRVNIKAGSFNMESNTLSCWLKLSSIFSAKSGHVECFELIARILRLFRSQLGTPINEALFTNEIQSLCKIFEEKKHNILPAFSWVLFICGCIVCDKSVLKYSAMESFCTLSSLSALNNFTKLLSELLLSCSNAICTGDQGEVCALKSDVCLAFKSRMAFTVLCLDFLKEKKEKWTELMPLIGDSFECLESILKQAINGKCVKSASLEGSLYDSYCSLGSACYSAEDWEHGRLFLLKSLSFYYTEKSLSSAELMKMDAVLSRLSICSDKQGHRKEAKAAVLLNTLLHLNSRTPQRLFYLEQWSGLQNGDPTDAKTADQILKRHPILLKTMCPAFVLNLKLIPELLVWELSCYVKHKMVNSSIVLNAWHALKASNPSPLHLIEGSALAGQALFSCSDTVAWHDVISASLSSWLCEIKDESKRAIALCAMAVHYHVKFLIMAQLHFDENESSVEERTIYSRNPATVRKPDDVIDPKDVCQIRSSFSNLTLHREQELIDLLETAVNYWNDSMEAGLSVEDHNTHQVVWLSGDYLLQAAYLSSLWGHNAAAAKAFQVCRLFAQKMHLDDLLLQALSGLMSTIEVKPESIAESDKVLKRLKSHPKYQYLSLVYSTSRAFQALRTKSYQEGVKALKDVMDLKPSSSSVWCHTYSMLVQAAYSLVPKTELDSGCRSARQGLSLSIHYVQGKRLSQSPLVFAALIHQALSSALWIGRYYRQHQMPREARCFLKPELMLALKLGLATRAAEFISELAFVDLVTESVDEARSKIGDLEGIIGNSLQSSATKVNSDDDPDDMIDTKDLIAPKDTRYVLGASPSLQMKTSPMTHHKMSCKCYSCKNSSVQNVLLMYIHLQAKTYMFNLEAHNSMQFYRTAFIAAKNALKRASQNPLLEGSLLHQHDIACSEVLLWLDFVDLLVMYEKDHDAKVKNQRVLDLVQHLKTDDKQLLSTVLEQKLCICKILKEKEKKTTDSGSLNSSGIILNQSTSPRIVVDTTPSNTYISSSNLQEKKRKPLKVVLTPNTGISPVSNQQFFTPKAPFGNRALFNDSDDDLFNDDETVACLPSKENASIPSKKNVLVPKKKTTAKITTSQTKEVNAVSKAARSLKVPKVKADGIAEKNVSALSKTKLSSSSNTEGLTARSKRAVPGASLSTVENSKARSSKTTKTDSSVGTSQTTTRVTRQKKK